MVYWYNLYSFWTAVMCIMSYFRVIPFSVIPSVVATIFGTLVFLYMKVRVGKQMGFTFVVLQIVLHMFPFLILPVQFTGYHGQHWRLCALQSVAAGSRLDVHVRLQRHCVRRRSVNLVRLCEAARFLVGCTTRPHRESFYRSKKAREF